MSVPGELPQNFIEQVKQALEKLYDFQALQQNSLAQRFDSQGADPHTSGARQLRSHLFDAIESLNPGQSVAAHSGIVRVYNLIYMHYVGRLTIQQAAWEIGVSLRQAYRDLQRGQVLVSSVLWQRLHAEAPRPRQDTSVDDELTRLEDNTTVTALQDLLESALRPVQILADKYAVAMRVDAPPDPISLTTNPIMAQQVLTHILSQTIQQVRPSSLRIRLSDASPFIRVQYASTAQPEVHIEPTIQQMMEQLHWELQLQPGKDTQEIALKSSRRRALLLVIDDNEGLIHLLQRYLTDDAYAVMSVPNTEQGLDIIPQLQPDVIILDVMMPGMDGWELLQRIRTRRETQSIPVMICSVINDPELAFALGASNYVSKPVTRESLLDALQALHI
ncbi:MAG: response regulator [Anaerolineae bacterium]